MPVPVQAFSDDNLNKMLKTFQYTLRCAPCPSSELGRSESAAPTPEKVPAQVVAASPAAGPPDARTETDVCLAATRRLHSTAPVGRDGPICRKGASHMAIVMCVNNADPNRDPFYEQVSVGSPLPHLRQDWAHHCRVLCGGRWES